MHNSKAVKSSIESSAGRVLAAYHSRFTPEMLESVAEVLLNALRYKSKPRLYDDDIEVIVAKLTRNKQLTRKSWQRCDCFNKLVSDLKKTSDIRSKYIYIPTQINRNLVVNPTDELQETIKQVQLLHDYLLEFPPATDCTIEKKEIEYVCSFIAAAGIFGKMLFDQYHRRLLTIKFRDIHFSPVYINMPYENSDAFYRYFLPYPASVYFMRLVLFYQRKYKELNIKRPYLQDDNIIVPVHFNAGNLATKFRAWAASRLAAASQKRGEPVSPQITIAQFRNAVKSASVADITPAHIQANCYPPFIISVQSGEIPSYSYSNICFPHFLGINDIEPEFRYPSKPSNAPEEAASTAALRKALTDIRKIRRGLLIIPDSLPERRNAADQIRAIVQQHEPPVLTATDYLNLDLFARWISDMFLYKSTGKKKSAETVDNYIPKVEDLLFQLSGISLLDMSVQERKEAVKRTMRSHSSPAIKKVIEQFFNYLEETLEGSFENLNWNDPELTKKEIPSLKPLITPGQIALIADLFSKYFLRKKKKQNNARRIAEHKASTLAHMTQTSFYSSMRIDEVASLRISDVIFDDGVILCIHDSKTDNGKRNIPFSRLASPSYVSSFMKYYFRRKREVSGRSYLFPQLSEDKLKDKNNSNNLIEKKWNTSYASREVEKVFRSHFSPDMVFHNTRDSFASLLLYRWFVLAYKGKLPTTRNNLPCYNDDIFSNWSLERLKELLLGMGKDGKKGQDLFTYTLAAISRIMGHGGPRITFKSYIHTTDWLFYMLSKHDPNQVVSLTSDQRVSFNQVTYTGLPGPLKGKGVKTIKVDELLNGQKSLIKIFRQKKYRK